jgi:hypothetical protein
LSLTAVVLAQSTFFRKAWGFVRLADAQVAETTVVFGGAPGGGLRTAGNAVSVDGAVHQPWVACRERPANGAERQRASGCSTS